MVYIKLFYDFLEKTSELTAEERGRLVEAMLIYAKDGEKPSCMTGNERFLFPVFQAQIDEDKQSYNRISEKRRAAVQSRWAKEQEIANEYKCMQEQRIKNKEKDSVVNNNNLDILNSYILNTNVLGCSDEALSKYLSNGMTVEAIKAAIDLAVGKSIRRWVYIDGILRNWLAAGVKTLEQAEAVIRQQPNAKPAQGRADYSQREYTEADFEGIFYDPALDYGHD